MNPDYLFPIGQVYQKTQRDKEETERFSDGKSHWGNNYKTFKQNIKKHLKKEQKGRCMFCRRQIDESQCSAEIEHILPKKKYPQFETLPENLVLSCHSCNNKKGKHVPLVNGFMNLTSYPRDPEMFAIIYPYKDKYEEHIDINEDDCIAVAKSSKGTETISLYDLNREPLVTARQRDLQDKQRTLGARLIFSLLTLDKHSVAAIIQELKQILNDC